MLVMMAVMVIASSGVDDVGADGDCRDLCW